MTRTSPLDTSGSRHRPWPRALQVLAVWGAATALSFLVLRLGAQDTPATPWGGAAPTWLEHMAFWDAGWYERVLVEGYPATLPEGPGGQVQANAWAFMPLLPYLCLPLTALGLPFYAAGALVATLASGAAAIVLDRWLAPRAGQETSLWAVGLLWASPCAPVLQTPYAESLGLLLVSGTLLLAERGRYLAALPVALLAAFSRPVGVPLSVALGLWWAWQVLSTGAVPLPAALARLRSPLAAWLPTAGGPVPAASSGSTADAAPGLGSPSSTVLRVGSGPRTALKPAPGPDTPARPTCAAVRPHGLLGLSLATGCAALSWPLLAALATGRADAYTATETAWRGQHLTPFLPWLERSGYFVGPHLGPLLLAAGLLLMLLTLTSPALRGLGPAAWWWCVGYLLYLLTFFDPTTSLLRLLLPLAPAAWALACTVRPRRRRLALLLLALVGQLFWVSWVWDLGSVTIQWVP